MNKQRSVNYVGTDMPKESNSEHIGPKLAMIGIVVMIIYLVIAQ